MTVNQPTHHHTFSTTESTMTAITQEQPTTTAAPNPGEAWPGQGGIYIGIRYTPGGAPVHLVAAIGEHEIEDAEWGPYGQSVEGATSYHDGRANTQAMAAAGSDLATRVLALDIDGHTDWHLPSQADAHLLAANAKHLMRPNIYWTSTQYSADYAWYQGFDYGGQYIGYKDCEFRAVPVRTIQIEL